MKKLIFIFLLIPIVLQAQEIGRFPFSKATVSSGQTASYTLTSTGTGAGVATLRMWSSSDISVTLTDNGNFYTDAGGTTGETKTWNITNGAMRTIYLKVTSSTSTMTISDATKVTRWGDADNDGWVSSTNAPSLAGSIAQFTTALTQFRTSGTSTMNGSITNLTGLTYFRSSGTISFSGSIAGLTSLTYIDLSSFGAGDLTINGSIAGLTSLTRLAISGGNMDVSGSIAGLTSLTYIYLYSTKAVITGSISDLTSVTRIWMDCPHTCSGTIANFNSATYIRIVGSQHTVGYGSRTWPANTIYFGITPSSGGGWSIANITAAVAEASGTTWTGDVTFSMGGTYNASMADTNQGGIWGDFDGETSPSTLATNFKTLVRTRGVTASLRGCTIPGGTGDGTGFPAGFGDWWRL